MDMLLPYTLVVERARAGVMRFVTFIDAAIQSGKTIAGPPRVDQGKRHLAVLRL